MEEKEIDIEDMSNERLLIKFHNSIVFMVSRWDDDVYVKEEDDYYFEQIELMESELLDRLNNNNCVCQKN